MAFGAGQGWIRELKHAKRHTGGLRVGQSTGSCSSPKIACGILIPGGGFWFRVGVMTGYRLFVLLHCAPMHALKCLHTYRHVNRLVLDAVGFERRQQRRCQ